jgi:glycerol-3-phosphate dehydrogenase
VIARERLPVPSAVVLSEGRRILFAIPWGERVILGTTDTDYQGPIEAVRTEPADVAYILSVVNAGVPSARLAEADVISTWAGLRPLVASRRGGPSDISRSHQIRMPEPGWLDVAGGKLTSYRHMAQQAVDRIVSHLGIRTRHLSTAHEPLLPPELPQAFSGILPPPVSREAVEHYCTHEWAVHLDDVMIRRTSWHYYHPNAAEIAAQAVAWMAALLGWDRRQQEAELGQYREEQESARPVGRIS